MITLTASRIAANSQVRPATLILPTPVCSRAVAPITVECILDNLFRQVGLTPDQYDLSAASDTVDGFVLQNRTSVKEAIEVLLRVYQVDLIEVDGQIVAKKRGAAAVATLTGDDIGAYVFSGTGQAEPRVTARRVQSLELPVEADITYLSYEKDYEQSSQRAVRSTVASNDDKLTVNTSLVLTDNVARHTIERLLYELWVHRESFGLILMPQWMYLAPGDCLNIPHAGQTRRVRIIAMDTALFGPIPVECVLDEIGVLTQTVSGGTTPPATSFPAIVTDTALEVFCTNALRDADADSVGFYATANGEVAGDWPGAILYMSRDDGATYQPVGELLDPGTFGVTTTTLAAPASNSTAVWDTVNTVDITLTAGTAPVSASAAEVLNGANAALIGEEVVQFQTVTALGGDSYRLSNLLRGRRGTDPFWGTHTSSDRFVLLENGGATARFIVDEGLVNKTVKLKAVTFGQTLADTTAVDLTICGDEYKPYTVAHLDACDCGVGNDDILIEWKRRTRTGGAWVDFKDADLGETTQLFEVDVMDGPVVVRTFTTINEFVVYSTANQTTDWGAPVNTLTLNVYQIGRYGRGYVSSGTFTV